MFVVVCVKSIYFGLKKERIEISTSSGNSVRQPYIESAVAFSVNEDLFSLFYVNVYLLELKVIGTLYSDLVSTHYVIVESYSTEGKYMNSLHLLMQ